MKNKNTKAKMQIVFGALLFALVFTAEIYVIVNYPQLYLAIAVLAVAELLFLYMVVWALMVMREQKHTRREEQYESIFKSEKASYLMLKKYFEEIEDKLNYIEKAAKVPTEEIINAQKGIAKVIVNRHKENSEALMTSNDMMIDQIKALENKIIAVTDSVSENRKTLESSREAFSAVVSSSRDQIIEQQRLMGEDAEKSVKVGEQELAAALKDMELRLNALLMQFVGSGGQQAAAPSPVAVDQIPVSAAPSMEAAASSQVQVGASTLQPAPKPVEPAELDELLAQMNSAQPAKSALEAFAKVKAEEAAPADEILDFGTVADEPETESTAEIIDFEAFANELSDEPEAGSDESDVQEESGQTAEIIDFAALKEAAGADSEAEPEIDEPNISSTIADMLAFEDEQDSADMEDFPEDSEPEPALEMEGLDEIPQAAEPTVDVPDLEPIADEPAEEPTVDIPDMEPLSDEAIDIPDMAPLSDEAIDIPNMAPLPEEPIDISEIDALADGPEAEAVEDIEPLPDEPIAMSAIDLSDPNKPMSPDDIAALLASMGA